MKRIHLLIVLFLSLFAKLPLQAQDSTRIFTPKAITIEEMIGDQRQFLQLLVNKVLTEKKKTGMLSITGYAADYENDLSKNEFQNTTLLYQRLFKGISINSGVSFTSVDGMKNFVGLQYMYQTRSFSVVYLPSYYFTHGQRFSNTALIEYKPEITEKWSLYSRLQFHYNHNPETGNHYRSYVYSRLGLTYGDFSFGLAHNYDCYGASRYTKNNYGVFLKFTL